MDQVERMRVAAAARRKASQFSDQVGGACGEETKGARGAGGEAGTARMCRFLATSLHTSALGCLTRLCAAAAGWPCIHAKPDLRPVLPAAAPPSLLPSFPPPCPQRFQREFMACVEDLLPLNRRSAPPSNVLQ